MRGAVHKTDLLKQICYFWLFGWFFQKHWLSSSSGSGFKLKQILKVVGMKSDAKVMLSSLKKQFIEDFIVLELKQLKNHHLFSASSLMIGNESKTQSEYI